MISVRRVWDSMNVEPALIFVAMSMSFLLTSQPQFQYWARCIEMGHEQFVSMNDSICSADLPDDDVFNKDIQKDIAQTRTYIQIAQSLPNVISAPLLGIWADRAGRKLPLIFSICGFCIYSILYIISTLTYRSINVYIWFFIAEAIWGMSGGSCGLIGTMFAMVIDETRKADTTATKQASMPMRIVIASALQNFGGFAGNIVITVSAGHESRYLMCAILQCVFIFATLLYVIFFVHETHHPNRIAEIAADRTLSYTTAVAESTDSEASMTSFKSSIISPKHIWDVILSLKEVLLKKRRGWIRFCLICSLGVSIVELIVLDINYIYLYIKLPAFAWSDSLFSLFMTIRGLCAASGMLLGPLLLWRLKMFGKDSLFIMIGCLGGAVSFLMLAFAANSATVFATSFLYFLVGFCYPGGRSFVPRLVGQNETARILSITGVVMIICPIISAAVFNSLYHLTLDWWPGFSFLVAGVFLTIAMLGQLLFHILLLPLWREDAENEKKSEAMPSIRED